MYIKIDLEKNNLEYIHKMTDVPNYTGLNDFLIKHKKRWPRIYSYKNR